MRYRSCTALVGSVTNLRWLLEAGLPVIDFFLPSKPMENRLTRMELRAIIATLKGTSLLMIAY
jgi:hypothetical protein